MVEASLMQELHAIWSIGNVDGRGEGSKTLFFWSTVGVLGDGSLSATLVIGYLK